MAHRSASVDSFVVNRRFLLAWPLMASLPACAAPGRRAPERQVAPSAARRAVLHAQTVVSAGMWGPTDAARLYAYTTWTFRDVYRAHGEDLAMHAVRCVVGALAAALPPEATPGGRHDVPFRVENLPRHVRSDVSKVLERADSDGRTDIRPPRPRPPGRRVWSPGSGVTAMTPGAGRWARWLSTGDGDPAPPPDPGTQPDLEQCQAVRDAVEARTHAQEQRIRFWRAGPGSVTPSGMWLDVADRLLLMSSPIPEPDLLALVAAATADAAGACWRLKYSYWTARPSQRMPGLRTANADPPFPAYPSGHSTMSRAAAEVLAAVYPASAGGLLAMAREARDTRLLAGVHFPVDNDAGFVVGAAVARSALRSAGLA